MMEMMFAINKDNFDGHREVTCYSCHRGNAHPVAIPAVMTEESKEAMGEPHGTVRPKPERSERARSARRSTAR